MSFKDVHFPQESILTCVRWDVAYALRDRQAEEFMEERGVDVDHATIHQWVVTYSPQLEEVFHERMQNLGIWYTFREHGAPHSPTLPERQPERPWP